MEPSLDLSGTNIDKYHLIKKIGNGNFGAVYHVLDRALQTEKAIKILDIDEPQKALELLKEAQIPYKCNHKNIVRINEANVFLVEDDFKVVIDMELVNGGSLENKLATSFIPIVDGLRFLSDALYGIEHAHLTGIIHRDIKPANILIHNNRPKISDFGLAAPEGTAIHPWIWYRTHAAPELFHNSTATVTSDIFAFGMTLYRTVNNISDWRDMISEMDNADDMVRNGKLINALPFYAFVPIKVKRIIKKACAIDPQKRFQSAAELRSAIDKLQPNCKWHPIDVKKWGGVSFNGKDEYLAYVETTKRKNEFRFKRNNRHIHSETRTFSTREEAYQYMYTYIAQNTFA